MALRGTEPKFDLVYPNEARSHGLRPKKKRKIDASDSDSEQTVIAPAEPQPEPNQYNWSARGPKYVVALATGLDERVYPAINQCRGSQSDEATDDVDREV